MKILWNSWIMSQAKGFGDPDIVRWSSQSNEWWVMGDRSSIISTEIRIPVQHCGSAGTSPSHTQSDRQNWYRYVIAKPTCKEIDSAQKRWENECWVKLLWQTKCSNKANLQHPANWFRDDVTQPTGASPSLLRANKKFKIIKEHSPLYITRWEGRNEKVNSQHLMVNSQQSIVSSVRNVQSVSGRKVCALWERELKCMDKSVWNV